jgi:hypothetical protein
MRCPCPVSGAQIYWFFTSVENAKIHVSWNINRRRLWWISICSESGKREMLCNFFFWICMKLCSDAVFCSYWRGVLSKKMFQSFSLKDMEGRAMLLLPVKHSWILMPSPCTEGKDQPHLLQGGWPMEKTETHKMHGELTVEQVFIFGTQTPCFKVGCCYLNLTFQKI